MHKNCSVYRAADLIGKRWTVLILLELHKSGGVWKRYSHLKSRLGNITPKMLSGRLKELERESLVEKRVETRRFPVKCEYRLTRTGSEFMSVIKKMKSWSLKWKTGADSEVCKDTECDSCKL